MLHLVARGGGGEQRHLRQRYLAEGPIDHQRGKLFGLGASRIREDQHRIESIGVFVSLSRSWCRQAGLDGVQHVADLEATGGQRLGLQLQRQRGGAALRLELQIRDVGGAGQGGHDLVRDGIELVEITAIDLDGDIGGFAGQAFADAVAQKCHHFRLQAWTMRRISRN